MELVWWAIGSIIGWLLYYFLREVPSPWAKPPSLREFQEQVRLKNEITREDNDNARK
jgi:hypothetical protein